jgi:hypothetical protein
MLKILSKSSPNIFCSLAFVNPELLASTDKPPNPPPRFGLPLVNPIDNLSSLVSASSFIT